MVDAYEKGYKQSISTMVGHLDCIKYLAKSEAIDDIRLHLPDDNGMMEKGSLKVTNDYILRLRMVLDERLKQLNSGDGKAIVSTLTFGVNYHPEVAKVLNEAKYITLKSRYLHNSVHSRAGSLKVANLSGLVVGYVPPGSRKILKSFLKKFKFPFFICSHQKLLSPVLLGNGNINICCMDYSLRGVRGNLLMNKLSVLNAKWFRDIGQPFVRGQLSPCASCEYYQKASLYDLLKFLFRQSKY